MRSRFRSAPLALALLVALAPAVAAGPTVGFLETFPGPTTGSWGGNAIPTFVASGGTGGNPDGYLHVATPNGTLHNLGTVSFGTEYAGDWATAGVTQVRLWLNDVGADDPLEMHFALGNGTSFWQYNVGFLPPLHQWAEFVVDLSSSANWTRIIGTGTFTQALQGADRVLVRHDHAPFIQAPDALDGDFGLDHILLTNGTVGVGPGAAVVPRALILAPPSPNPSRESVTFAIEVFEPGAVRIEIVDAAGRLLRHAEVAAAAAGPLRWTWDGRADDGREAATGVYLVRAVGRSGGMSRTFARIR